MPRKRKVPAPELANWSPYIMGLALLAFAYVFLKAQFPFLVILLPFLAQGLATSPRWKSFSALFHASIILGSFLIAGAAVVYRFGQVRKP